MNSEALKVDRIVFPVYFLFNYFLKTNLKSNTMSSSLIQYSKLKIKYYYRIGGI
jgi:hypothetical protein